MILGLAPQALCFRPLRGLGLLSYKISRTRFAKLRIMRIITCLLAIVVLLGSTSFAQAPRTPTETMREFYRMMREKKYREAFGISIYRAAIEGLSAQEYAVLTAAFDKLAVAVSEKI